MSKQTRIAQFTQLYDALLALNPEELLRQPYSFSDFDGLNIVESKETLHFILTTLEELKNENLLNDLSWNTYNSLQGQLQNIHNVFIQFKSSPDQNSFQNLAAHLDSLSYHIRMFGLPHLAFGGAKLEKTTIQLAEELQQLIVIRAELEKLKLEVKSLIEPAVAGSLSKAFTDRKSSLLTGRIIWGVVTLLVGWYCLHSTYDFSQVVSDALKTAKDLPQQNGQAWWISIAIRTAILLPLYTAFGFAFSQYKKERDFEEEYAHKAAVATSLPNYGDLTREPAVRDQIVAGATTVIFSSPTSKSGPHPTADKMLKEVKDLLESASKFIPKKD